MHGAQTLFQHCNWKRCLGSSWGSWQCLSHPSVPKKRPAPGHTELQLAERQPGLSSGSCQDTFYGAFHLFLWISTALCAQTCLLTVRKWPARKAVPHCMDGVKSVKKVHLSFLFLSGARISLHFCFSPLGAVTGVVQLCLL